MLNDTLKFFCLWAEVIAQIIIHVGRALSSEGFHDFVPLFDRVTNHTPGEATQLCVDSFPLL